CARAWLEQDYYTGSYYQGALDSW
nr:immunoglobulin heavy chain junction region [Macaca mulatta]MOX95936.1 immunoglobulin heavy chain junction region [Macaca mulatta]MOX96679.1 immunoglobulin heavy chain junction region [Macaca mulatta]